MNSKDNKCNCSEHGYSPDCPSAFFQGGKMVHVLDSENQLKPRLYNSQNEKSGIQSNVSHEQLDDNKIKQAAVLAGETYLNRQMVGPTRSDDKKQCLDMTSMYEEIDTILPTYNSHTVSGKGYYMGSKFQDDNSMMEENRKSLRRFEPLNVGGQTLTGMSIGGYVVDLSQAAQKASEVAPLPPSKLPIIFVDDNMNFHHHFFQGLDILLGKNVVNEIVNTTKYYDRTSLHLMPMIEKMIRTGYQPSDNEITVFTKKVLTSTFDVGNQSCTDDKNKFLIVAANLWGFQYIECGMQMREPDLKMWLQNCHCYYRTIWFNTFKSAGVPDFALHGVQTRYENLLSNQRPERNMESTHKREQAKSRNDDSHDKKKSSGDRYSNSQRSKRQSFW